MKTTITILCVMAIAICTFGQTSLQGTVTDAESGEPIIFGTIALYKNDVLITGTETDFDGFYSITELDPGTYDVVFSYTGYQDQKVTGVIISSGKTNKLDAKISSGVNLECVVVTYSRPFVSKNETTQGKVYSAEEIKNLPRRNVSGLASLGAGSKSKKRNKKLRVRGSRSNTTNYYIDGVRVSGKQLSKEDAFMRSPQHDPSIHQPQHNTEDYSGITENAYKSPLHEPLSTFSIDVDRASYSNIRRYINRNQLPPVDAVRIEEMINYFDYDYPQPNGDDPFSVNTELVTCPWNDAGSLLLKVGLKGKDLKMKDAPPNNLVFLIDVSGSMKSANKIELLKPAFQLLVDQLRPEDRVAIVVYAGAAGLVLPSTSGAQKDSIITAIKSLQAGGSTAGAAGIQLAYKIAKENLIENGNNRVILATDGDFNVGISSDGQLKRLIEEKRDDGIFLTCLGFGMGNYKDNKLETLADKGNGNYAYIDNLLEAKKSFVTDLTGTLFTIAKDVKIQIEFNPNIVKAYRLIGYENRLLNKEDFNDDTKDAGEIGAGHTVTALYEIIPHSAEFSFAGSNVDSLKYQSSAITPKAQLSGELLTLKLRYKAPKGIKSKLISTTVEHRWKSFAEATKDMQWATAIASYGMLLRNSAYKGNLTYKDLLEMATKAKGKDKNGYRSECLKLMETTEMLGNIAGK